MSVALFMSLPWRSLSLGKFLAPKQRFEVFLPNLPANLQTRIGLDQVQRIEKGKSFEKKFELLINTGTEEVRNFVKNSLLALLCAEKWR